MPSHQIIQNLLTNRLHFTLDVNPHQKNIYKSDEFSIRSQKTNGRIACIQGVKQKHEKMLQVLPKIRVRTFEKFEVLQNFLYSILYRFPQCTENLT